MSRGRGVEDEPGIGAVDVTQLSGDNVAKCLQQTELALVEYEKAATLGLVKDPDFVEVFERAKLRRGRLQTMLKHVRAMETDQLVDGR